MAREGLHIRDGAYCTALKHGADITHADRRCRGQDQH